MLKIDFNRIICTSNVEFSELIKRKSFTIIRESITQDFLHNLNDYCSGSVKITNSKKTFDEIQDDEYFYILSENVKFKENYNKVKQ